VLGVVVGAVVLVRRGARVTETELQDHVRAHLAAFKVPVRIIVQDEPLPRNPNGKIVKPPLRERFLAQA
jgi:long-chain acyl-CoA synthetase